MGLVPKKEPGQFRLIHDLSYPKGQSANSCIPSEFTSVNYQNIETVVELVQLYGPRCLMATCDIQDAFFLLLIHKDDHHLLGFHWLGPFYYSRVLPMGASTSSPQMFESFSSALQWILKSKFNVKGVSNLLDDFFFVGKSDSLECLSSLNTFLTFADSLGVPIKTEKTNIPQLLFMV